MTHEQEIAAIRDRQMRIVKRLPPEDAIVVLTNAPIDNDDAHEYLADILQRRTLFLTRRGTPPILG